MDHIPFAISFHFRRKPTVTFSLNPGEIVLCNIGRLIPRKDVVASLNVFSYLKDSINLKCLVVAEGLGRDHIENTVSKLGLLD